MTSFLLATESDALSRVPHGRTTRWVKRTVGSASLAALLVSGAWAADAPQPGVAAAASAATKKSAAPSPYVPNRFSGRAGTVYAAVYGIDSITVKLVESGELVRFSYRVLDPDKARLLHDKQAEPTLHDPQAGVSLVVPTMEKVGPLRQAVPPQAGRSYWMTFSNKGRRVARGDRVDVVIGQFRANNLVVD